MLSLIDLSIVSRLDDIIRAGTTGDYDVIAKMLGISKTSFFYTLSYLVFEMRAPITFNKHKNRYEYAYNPKFYLNAEVKQLLDAIDITKNGKNHPDLDASLNEYEMDDEALYASELIEIYGGIGKIDLNNDWPDVDLDLDDEHFDDEVDFNDLFPTEF